MNYDSKENMMSYTIMIVDDSSTIRDIIERILIIVGVPLRKIIKCGNGLEAKEILKNNDIDLVITDIHMPLMDGVSLIKVMKEEEKLKNIPIIVITSEESEKRKVELISMGVNDFLLKPFTPEKIRNTIKSILGVMSI